MRIHYLLIIVVLSVLLLSCEKDNGPLASSPFRQMNFNENIIPLAVGNQWVYIDSTFGGSIYVDSTCYCIIDKGVVEYQSRSYRVFYRAVLDYATLEFSDLSWLFANTSDGINCFGGVNSQGNSFLTKTLFLKYPVNVGDTWNELSICYRDNEFWICDTIARTVVSVDELFMTPAGNFHCCVYSRLFENDTVLDYYSVNIGHVGQIIKHEGNIYQKSVLKSYKIH